MKIKVTIRTQAGGQSIERSAEAESDYKNRSGGSSVFSIEEDVASALLRVLKKDGNTQFVDK